MQDTEVLKGHSILLVEDAPMVAEPLFQYLDSRGMRVDYEEQLPPNLLNYLLWRKLESALIHLPGTNDKARLSVCKTDILTAFAVNRRIGLYEGISVSQATRDTYSELRKSGVPIVDKRADSAIAMLIGFFSQTNT